MIGNSRGELGVILIDPEESWPVVKDRVGPRQFSHVQNNRGATAILHDFFLFIGQS